jgi:hypothetical protein
MMEYEFVCAVSMEFCLDRILDRLKKRDVPYQITETNPANRWFRLDIQNLEFEHVKSLVRSLQMRGWLRFVRPLPRYS